MKPPRKHSGSILGIAVKTVRRGPMKELDSAYAKVDGGLVEDLPVSAKRGITLLEQKAWTAACKQLGCDLPWTTRRVNLLTEGLELEKLIGKILRIGEVELSVGGETTPCDVMDQLHPGLQEALRPDCRGGVYGRVIREGNIRVGDEVRVVG